MYAGDVSGEQGGAQPSLAALRLVEEPDLASGDPYAACAVGNESAVREQMTADPAWVNRAGGPLNLPPLVAATHSSLLQLPEFRESLRRVIRLLLESGADPNQSTGSRSPPGSLSNPDTQSPLSALYGASGQNSDAEATRVLLRAGANPNDNESLYHSLTSPECTRLLLEAGARVEGSNAFYRIFDLDNLASLQLLLAFGANPNEPARNAPLTDFGTPLLWAIRRRRSRAHTEALLAAGADASARTPDGRSAYQLALHYGLTEVADLLQKVAPVDALTTEDQFVAACARADEQEARRILAGRPDLPASLSQGQLRLLPDLAAEGCDAVVRLMVELGWPISVRGGDWNASALNLAVFRGDAPLTRFLLDHGASWKEPHGFGGDVRGTLSWASANKPTANGNWLACAEALVEHGMPPL